MQQKTILRSVASVALCAAALGLAGCKKEPEPMNIGTGDPQASELANAAPVELPPALKASKTLRCKDNSLVYIDFMADDLTAHLKTDKAGAITNLKAPEKGQAFVSEDGSTKVEGSGDEVTLTLPGKSAQSCKK
jgi:hypothetical protein